MTTQTTHLQNEYEVPLGDYSFNDTFTYTFQVSDISSVRAEVEFPNSSVPAYEIPPIFVVTPNSDNVGGTIRLSPQFYSFLNSHINGASVTTTTMRVFRDTIRTQNVDLVNHGSLDVEVLEELNDKFILITQEIDRAVSNIKLLAQEASNLATLTAASTSSQIQNFSSNLQLLTASVTDLEANAYTEAGSVKDDIDALIGNNWRTLQRGTYSVTPSTIPNNYSLIVRDVANGSAAVGSIPYMGNFNAAATGVGNYYPPILQDVDGVARTFTIPGNGKLFTPLNSIMVFYNGVAQSDFTISGRDITFNFTPTAGSEILVFYHEV